MKKILVLPLFIFLFISCDDYTPIYELKILPIIEAKTPVSFTYRTSDTITLKYTLPNACYTFRNLYYESERNSRVVAVYALKDSEITCTQATIEKELKIPIHVLQEEDYLFKFYKGKDADGKSIFEEITVPVN